MSQNPPNWPETQGLTQDKPRKKRGCFFWGCTGCGIVVVIALVFVFIGYMWIKGFADQYFQDKAQPVPTVTFNQAELDAAEQKFEGFQKTVEIDYLEKNALNPVIKLSERELNMLVNKEDALKDSLYIDFEENNLNLEVSIKIPDEIPIVGGKYFNGTAQGGIAIIDGMLRLNVTHAEAAGHSLPNTMYENISKGIEEQALEAAETRLWLSTINKLEIRKDEIHIEFNRELLLRQLKMEKERNK
jgi:hypothetical protein